jgi:hypothetical protein
MQIRKKLRWKSAEKMDRAFERFWRLESSDAWLEGEEKKELREGRKWHE